MPKFKGQFALSPLFQHFNALQEYNLSAAIFRRINIDFARCSIPESKHCEDEDDDEAEAIATQSPSSSSLQCLDSGMLQRAKSILVYIIIIFYITYF